MAPLPVASGIFGVPDISVRYQSRRGFLEREARAGQYHASTHLALDSDAVTDIVDKATPELASLWAIHEMRGRRAQIPVSRSDPAVRVVDLFCGCGGFAVGVQRAALAVGTRATVAFAADVNAAPLRVYRKNVRPLRAAQCNVETLLDYALPTPGQDEGLSMKNLYLSDPLSAIQDTVDILIAGPPCQGNSNLNNRTRRFDRRNDLYFDAVAAAIALRARVVIVENVPAVIRAQQDVVRRSVMWLAAAGYRVSDTAMVLTASDYGTPQTRKRHFLFATRSDREFLPETLDVLHTSAVSASSALGDLLEREPTTTFDRPSVLSKENERRVRYLVESDEYDLPDRERPDCHRTKDHNYRSIYGRILPDQPAPTITTGFLSPGRGRFTHPSLPRSLTPREGARLQGFGDDFDWHPPGQPLTRNDYAQMIGSAVPPQLGFAVGMAALSALDL